MCELNLEIIAISGYTQKYDIILGFLLFEKIQTIFRKLW